MWFGFPLLYRAHLEAEAKRYASGDGERIVELVKEYDRKNGKLPNELSDIKEAPLTLLIRWQYLPTEGHDFALYRYIGVYRVSVDYRESLDSSTSSGWYINDENEGNRPLEP